MRQGSLLLAFMATATAASGSTIAIEHRPLDCIVADAPARVEACFRPPANVARARAYFRCEESQSWQFVALRPEGACFAGALPRCDAGMTLGYYLEVVDLASRSARTAERTVRVVRRAQDCGAGRRLAAIAHGAAPTVRGCGKAGAGVPLLAVVAGGAAAAAGGIALAASGGDAAAPTVDGPAPVATPSAAPTPQPTSPPPTTPAPTPNPGPTPCTDATPPSVVVTSPAEGQIVTVTPVRLSAEASDNVAVLQVEFFVRPALGGSPSAVGADQSAPYEVTWTPQCSGLFRVFARATDTCGNSAVSPEVGMTVTVGGLRPCL